MPGIQRVGPVTRLVDEIGRMGKSRRWFGVSTLATHEHGFMGTEGAGWRVIQLGLDKLMKLLPRLFLLTM